jgi:hypothetical protein
VLVVPLNISNNLNGEARKKNTKSISITFGEADRSNPAHTPKPYEKWKYVTDVGCLGQEHWAMQCSFALLPY